MFNDPADFLQQVDEQIEKVPEQHSNDLSSENLSPLSNKGISPSNSLKGRLSVKKNTAPYRPSNYKHIQMSPSPKRTNVLQTAQTMNNGGNNFYQGHYGNTNFENPGYMAQETNEFTLKLNKAQSAHHSVGHPMLQRAHSFSMGYNDPARIQAYPSSMIQPGINHIQDGANIVSNPFIQSSPYAGPYDRECYSPEVARGSYPEPVNYERYSNSMNPHEQWNTYSANSYQAQMYPQQMQQRQSAPETKIKTSESSNSSTVDRMSMSQVEDVDQKSQSTCDEVGANFDMSNSDLIENAIDLAKDQSGCRLLQKKIMEGDAETVASIYSTILPRFVELMNNPFGNYLCQKITDVCGKDHIKDIIEIIKADIVSICCNAHGTRAIQRIIECSKDKELIELMSNLLMPHVKTLVEDINGNHVIQKILFTFKAPDNEFIFQTMINDCFVIACHKHG